MYNTIGGEIVNNRIKEVRKTNNLTQDEYAEKLRISKNYVCLLETGKKAPGDRLISDICREFSISEAWLRYGEGEMLVQRSANDQLAILVNDLLAEPATAFRKRFLQAMLELPTEDWNAVERFIQKLQQGGKPSEITENEITQSSEN